MGGSIGLVTGAVTEGGEEGAGLCGGTGDGGALYDEGGLLYDGASYDGGAVLYEGGALYGAGIGGADLPLIPEPDDIGGGRVGGREMPEPFVDLLGIGGAKRELEVEPFPLEVTVR